MAGFRVNGIGATDHFKKIRSLGVFTCPHCGKNAEFFLEMAKFKIDIFYIPTITLKARYVIMCSQCENGTIISDDEAARLMKSENPELIANDIPAILSTQSQNTVPLPQLQDSTSEKSLTGSTPHRIENPNVNVPTLNSGKETASPSFFKCPHCGIIQLREGNFCAYCGKPAPNDQPNTPNGEAPQTTCPACGARAKSGASYCGQCGHKLI